MKSGKHDSDHEEPDFFIKVKIQDKILMKNKKGSPGKGRMNTTGVRSWE